MPYVVPTVDQFLTRFPIFSDEDEDRIAMVIAEASRMIDQTWREADYQPAILYLAAHLLATDNSGEGESVEIGAAGAGRIQSESWPGMSVTYGAGNMQGSLSKNEAFGSTEYGRRFLSLLRLNKPAIVVI